MRLLERNDSGKFNLTKEFIDDIPAYAILSHTWGDDEQEVTFKDLAEGSGDSKDGYQKIQFCGEQAARDGLRYFWVDTCCIDKSNNVEVSEAINSMFRWYYEAARCYVYLTDISIHHPDDQNLVSESTWESAFRKSRWFTRGWTLQELIAPASVTFFSTEGTRLGDKRSLEKQLCKVTGIPVNALQRHPLSHFSVDERISWAAKRDTKRKEDKAYSLMGIFDIHMPLIYGEGKDKAFTRLLNEFHKSVKEPEIPTAKHLPAEPNNTTLMSPIWLKPRVMMPSQDFEANVKATDPSIQLEVAETILSNCRVACFDFYRLHKLCRTKFNTKDLSTDPKVFQLDTGGFPRSAKDLNLRNWLVRIQRAISRLNHEDSLSTSAFHDWSSMGDILSRAARICAMVNYCGILDTENFEENLLISLQICWHLNGWICLGRLKVLWEQLHRPSAEDGGATLTLDLERLQPPPEELCLAGTGH